MPLRLPDRRAGRRAALAAFLLAAAACAPAGPPPRTVSVAAASNLRTAMEALERAFEAANPGVDVAVSTGASGALLAQLEHGAPFDVLLSADRDIPRRVIAAGLAQEGDTVYAIGVLVAWVPRGSPIRLEEGLAALAAPGVRKVAIANPEVAPYGRAAEAALRSAGVDVALRGRLVLGKNAAQAAQFAESGAADAALVPLAAARAPAMAGGRVLVVPPGTYPALEQSAVVLKRARDPALARAFLAFVTGPDGRAVLERAGYGLP